MATNDSTLKKARCRYHFTGANTAISQSKRNKKSINKSNKKINQLEN